MVRKRSRTSRKYYDSDENDSDSDYAWNNTPAEPPRQKKYSLRQRKRPLFTEDFDYDDDGDEVQPPKANSDDEDFEVEQELELGEAADTHYVSSSTYINHYEPESDDMPEDAQGLIDFEDMIRADIVVNKNRIDYDNIIQKTEIKVLPIEETQQTPPVKSKRGRKPKIKIPDEVKSNILEPVTEVKEHESVYENEEDKSIIKKDKDECIDFKHISEKHLDENNENELPGNEASISNVSSTEKDEAHENISKECTTSEQSVDKVNDVTLNDKIPPDDTLNVQSNVVNTVEDETKTKDDDEVVLVEDKKCEVIVLDD